MKVKFETLFQNNIHAIYNLNETMKDAVCPVFLIYNGPHFLTPLIFKLQKQSYDRKASF